jgi:hypothetical protein
MLVQAAALGLLVVGNGAFAVSLASAVFLGAGTAMVYPTLIAACGVPKLVSVAYEDVSCG